MGVGGWTLQQWVGSGGICIHIQYCIMDNELLHHCPVSCLYIYSIEGHSVVQSYMYR